MSTQSLSWERIDSHISFKSLCDSILLAELGSAVQLFGAEGPDLGIDAAYVGEYAGQRGRFVFQYKYTDTHYSSSEGRRALERALRGKRGGPCELGKPGPMRSDHYIIMTTANLNPQFTEKWEEKAVEIKAPYKKPQFWDRAELEALIKSHEECRGLIALFDPLGAIPVRVRQSVQGKPDVEIGKFLPSKIIEIPPSFSISTEFEEETLQNIESIPLEEVSSLGPLVGRELEKDVLTKGISSDMVSVILGPPGIGKTHLLAHVASSTKPKRLVFWYTMRQGLVSLESLAIEMTAFVFRHDKAEARRIATSDLSPLQKARIALKYMVELRAIIVLDNLQEAENIAELKGFLEEIVSSKLGTAILCASRYDIGLRSKAISTTQFIALSGLNEPESFKLLRELGIDCEPKLAGSLWGWTEGNPKLLELSASWVLATKRVPRNLRDLMENSPSGLSIDGYIISEIYKSLTDDERALLDTASLLRHPPNASFLSLASGVPNAVPVIEKMRQQFLLRVEKLRPSIVEPPLTCFSIHSMLRDFILAWMPANEKYTRHWRVALCLSLHAERVEDFLESSYHFGKTDSWNSALAVLHYNVEFLMARGCASRLFEFLKAADTHNLNPPARLWLLWALGQCHEFFVNLDCAKKLYTKLVKDGQRLGLKSFVGSAETGLGLVAEFQGDLASAEKHFKASLAISEEIGDIKTIGVNCNNIANILSLRGDFREARHYYEKDLHICETTKDIIGRAKTLSNLASVALHSDDLVIARKYAANALKLRRKLGDRGGQGHTLCVIAQIVAKKKQFNKAYRYLDKADSIADEISSAILREKSIAMRHGLLLDEGRTDDAEFVLEQHFQLSVKLGLLRETGSSALRLASLKAEKGLYEDALQYLELATNPTQAKLENTRLCAALCFAGSIAALLGKLPDADKYFERSKPLWPDSDPLIKHHIFIGLILLKSQAGENQHAWNALLELLKSAIAPSFWQDKLFKDIHEVALMLLVDKTIISSVLDNLMQLVEKPSDLGGEACAAWCKILLGYAKLYSRNTERVEELLREAELFATKAGYKLLKAAAQIGLAKMLRWKTEYTKAIELLQRLIDMLRQEEGKPWLQQTLIQYGNTCIDAGRSDDAIQAIKEAEDLAEKSSKDNYTLADIAVNLASAYGLNNQLDQCRQQVEKAEALIGENNWPGIRGMLAYVQGNLAMLDERPSKAFDLYALASEQLGASSSGRPWVMALFSKLQAAVITNRPDKEILKCLRAAQDAAEKCGLTEWLSNRVAQS